MRSRLVLLLVPALLAGACTSGEGAAGTAVPASEDGLPTGATIGSEGFATILDAPPAPFTPTASGEPEPPSPRQVADMEQFWRIGEFQNLVMEEVQALAGRLRRDEEGNFVTLVFDNEGEPSVVFQFLRDGPETLRKYSSNPAFRAVNVRFSEAELMAAAEFMWETFREDRVIESTGVGNGRNRAVVRISVPEEEFRALVARKGVTIPEAVELEFPVTRPAGSINAPLPPRIARWVRIFPRDDRPTGVVNAINSYAKIVLRDGCFRLGDQDDALVLFPLGAQLFVDSAGYLAFGTGEHPGYARVGEQVVFPGSIGEVTAPDLVAPIHATCGPGKVVKVTAMKSAAAESAQQAVADEANALRQLRESYGLTSDQAKRALRFLDERQAEARQDAAAPGQPLPPPPPAAIVSTPPRPVTNQSECPPGTTLSFGLCRTPKGYIRPLPQWLEEFLAQD